MAEQQDYLPADFERVSPLRPRRVRRDDRDDPVVVAEGAAAAPSSAEAPPDRSGSTRRPGEGGAAPVTAGAASPDAGRSDGTRTGSAATEEAEAPGAAAAPSAPPRAEPQGADPGATTETAGRTLEDRLSTMLRAFIDQAVEIHASAVVSLDGFMMAAALPSDLEEDRVAAMSAAILALGERASNELRRGRLSQVFIEGEDGYVLLMSCGSRAALVSMASREAKLGLVFYDMRRVAQEVARTLAAG